MKDQDLDLHRRRILAIIMRSCSPEDARTVNGSLTAIVDELRALQRHRGGGAPLQSAVARAYEGASARSANARAHLNVER